MHTTPSTSASHGSARALRRQRARMRWTSTGRLWRTARAAGSSLYEFLHGYVYARWVYAYIGAAIGEKARLRPLRLLFAPFLLRALRPQSWAQEYHGKAVSTQQATRLIRVDQSVDMCQSEQVIPFETARRLVLEPNQRIVVLDCPCRLSREHPCQPVDVCLAIGEPFAGFVLAHNPGRAREITADEAEQILRDEAARGHMHHAFFKKAMMGRFYAICNCCSCCCGAVSAQREGTPMLISSGYVASVDEAMCRGCGVCVAACAFDAPSLVSVGEGQGSKYAVVDPAVCLGCGVCVTACPAHAMSLRRDVTKPAPLEIPDATAPAI